ncbi:MAG TPA: beta-glucosidase, partial [Clostridiales bacterium]|nr:beta-glucosidase [Clostridiales bacterium]
KDSGKIKKIVILLNSVNQVQCDYVDNAEYGIDAVLWVGEGGATGTRGIGKILTGVSPSGKLTDTYWVEHYFNPVYANFGEFANAGETVPGGIKSTKYLVYQEGIYNGYRYTETRY